MIDESLFPNLTDYEPMSGDAAIAAIFTSPFKTMGYAHIDVVQFSGKSG